MFCLFVHCSGRGEKITSRLLFFIFRAVEGGENDLIVFLIIFRAGKGKNISLDGHVYDGTDSNLAEELVRVWAESSISATALHNSDELGLPHHSKDTNQNTE